MKGLPLATFALCLIATPAVGAPCGPRGEMIGYLHDRYQEQPVAIGEANEGASVVFLASKDGATWTILINLSNGQSCMIASGTNWNQTQAVPTGDSL